MKFNETLIKLRENKGLTKEKFVSGFKIATKIAQDWKILEITLEEVLQ